MAEQVIWKFPLAVAGHIEIEMPVGSQILCVQVQHGRPTIWAIVSTTTEQVEQRLFSIIGTGQEVPGGMRHIGTFQMAGGDFVGHVFEKLRD